MKRGLMRLRRGGVYEIERKEDGKKNGIVNKKI